MNTTALSELQVNVDNAAEDTVESLGKLGSPNSPSPSKRRATFSFIGTARCPDRGSDDAVEEEQSSLDSLSAPPASRRTSTWMSQRQSHRERRSSTVILGISAAQHRIRETLEDATREMTARTKATAESFIEHLHDAFDLSNEDTKAYRLEWMLQTPFKGLLSVL